MIGSRRKRGRPAGIIAALAACVLLVTGCVPTSGEQESVRQEKAFPDVYGQSIAWGQCDDAYGLTDSLSEALASNGAPVATYTCAMVRAPLDWNDPNNTETIELAALHIPSTGSGTPMGALLSNPGGPGASGIDLAYNLAVDPAFSNLLEHYDVLGFDPRGIGRSTPVGCAATSSIQELNLAVCAKASPLALTMGTSQVARDMELLRHLVDDQTMHYLGYSYGTVLGATYSTLFPERVGRIILDSASSSNWASPIGNFDQSVAISREIEALLVGCGTLYEAPTCPVDGESRPLTAVEIADIAPLVATDGTTVDGAMLQGYLTTALYQRAVGRTLVLETLAEAIGGDQTKIDEIATEMTDGGASVALDGMIVRCHSFPTDAKLPELVEHISQDGLPELMGGPEITDDTLKPFVDLSCDALPNSGDDFTDSFSGSPDAPMLVIGITGDHATPYEGAKRLVAELGNATLLTLEGNGHGASYSQRSTCIDDFATAYLVKGTVPPAGTICEDD